MLAMRRFALFSFALALVLAAGCADNYGGRVEVTGSVKLKGQPLKSGIVIFEPLAGQGTSATANVADGTYLIPRSSGLKPGKYLIRITAGDGKTPANLDPDEPPGPGGKGSNIVSKELVPAEWNTKSKKEKEVTSESPNTIDFDVQ
jgi:hypothetical protein